MIRFENVSVGFERGDKSFLAVDNVSLEIRKGEFYGIIGSSGAGKSTLVRTVNLLQRPTSGHVFVDNHDVTSYSGKELRDLRLKIGMIFQHFNLVKNSTVAQNVAFALLASDTPKEKIKSRVTELLSLVGLADKADVYPSSLSGGQKQRVAIARALANNPEILLCDEATSALDPDNTREVIQTLKRIKEKYPLTILFITHQMEVAKSLFDRIAVMHQGKLIEYGDSYDIFANPKHKATENILSKDVLNLIPGEVLEHEKALYVITYREAHSYDPVIATVSRNYPEVDLSIIAGEIEYIRGKPLGRLVISLRGKEQSEIDTVIEYLKKSTVVKKIDLGNAGEE